MIAVIEAQAGQVSGTFAVNGTPMKLTSLSAVTYDTASQGRMVSVLASEKPADAKKFQEYTRIGPGEKYVPGLITGAWVALGLAARQLIAAYLSASYFAGYPLTTTQLKDAWEQAVKSQLAGDPGPMTALHCTLDNANNNRALDTPCS